MFDPSNKPVTSITYRIHRLVTATEMDSLWLHRAEPYGQRIGRDEMRERLLRGLREDPKNEANVYLRHFVKDIKHGAGIAVLTELVYGEREETETKFVDVPYETTRTVSWGHVWARWEPASWWDAFKMTWPTLLLMCFPPSERWAREHFSGADQHIFRGITPYTYVETRKWLRDPFIEDRYGKLDRGRVDIVISEMSTRG